MSSFRADFKFCGTFSGKEVPASKWLKKLDWELEGYAVDGVIPPHRYVQALDLLLTEEAAVWAESHPQASAILSSEDPTQESVKNFRSLMCERFPFRTTEVTTTSFNAELSELKQQDESLAAYYKRVTAMMERVGARDRPSTITRAVHGTPLSLLEEAMLDTIMRSFLKGLSDPDVRREATRGLASPDSSLKGIYNLAEQARRTKDEVSKLDTEEHKTKEIELLRSIVQKTMSKSQLESLISSYQTRANSNGIPSDSVSSQSEWTIDRLGKALEDLRSNSDRNRRIPDQGEAPRPFVAQNYNRRNDGGPGFRNEGQQKTSTGRTYRPPTQTRELPDRKQSKNPFVNGTRIWSMKDDGPLCVRGGCLGKRSNDGHQCTPLPAWEQSYLREAVFGSSPQANFAAASFGEFDGASRVWEWPSGSSESSSSSSRDSTPLTPITSASSSVKSVIAKSSFHAIEAFRNQGAAAQVQYGEGSAPGKRPADSEDIQQQQQPAPHDRRPQQDEPHPRQSGHSNAGSQPQQPAQQSTQPQQPGYQSVPPHPMPPGAFQPFMPTSQTPPPVSSQERPKRKGQRRVGKKVELQPLVGMYNDSLEKFESPISIRQVMQTNKIDMTLMDMLAWSPAMCKEMKRLCTRVTKKRTKKQLPTPHAAMPQFPVFPPQFATAPAYMPQSMPAQNQPTGTIPMQGPSSSHATVSQVQAQPDAHTRRLSAMAGTEKAFHIPGEVRANGVVIPVEKKYVYADQGSEMSVMSTPMVIQLSLVLRPLSEVGFVGLCMETADHRETLLQHWVTFDFCTEGLWRTVRCFVRPSIPEVPDTPRLLLGLPWLHDINAVISVRNSSIQIGDPSIGETVRLITGPELTYHRDHGLLMYPKAFIPAAEVFRSNDRITEADDDDDEEDEDSSDSSEDSLSDIEEDESTKQGFH